MKLPRTKVKTSLRQVTAAEVMRRIKGLEAEIESYQQRKERLAENCTSLIDDSGDKLSKKALKEALKDIEAEAASISTKVEDPVKLKFKI